MSAKKKTGTQEDPKRYLYLYEWDAEKKSFVKNDNAKSTSLSELVTGRCKELDESSVLWEIRDENGMDVLSCAYLERVRLRDEP